MIKKTLAILAGGKGSRMNYENKAMLIYNDKTFIENLIAAGKNFEEIIIVANDKAIYEKYKLKVVQDIYKECGPLGGIHSALVNSKFEKVFCIACDMPLLNEEVLNNIGKIEFEEDILFVKSNDNLQPLCSIYSKSILSSIENNLINKKNKLKLLANENNHRIIDIDNYNSSFVNINTYEELGALYKVNICFNVKCNNNYKCT